MNCDWQPLRRDSRAAAGRKRLPWTTRVTSQTIHTTGSAAMNIILIVSDTFRYDHIGANGNPGIRHPPP